MIGGRVKTTVKSRDVNWSRFKKASESFKGMRTEVGLPEQGRYRRNASSRVKSYKQLIEVAFTNEFGDRGKKIPERALFRTTFDIQKKRVQRMMNAGARDIFLGKKTVETVMFEVGEFLTQKIRDRLIKKFPPKNAPLTIRLKGFDHPLLETGQLYDNIQHREFKALVRRNRS
jgi:hypothetical protein